jgi:hypothetical protein
MQGFSAEKSKKHQEPSTKAFLLNCYNTCESFTNHEHPTDSHQSSRKQTFSATPFRDSVSSKLTSSKNIPPSFSSRPSEEAIQKFKTFQGETLHGENSFFFKKKRFEPSSKLHLLKATLPPLNPNKQSSLATLSQFPEKDPSFPVKEKLESIESSTSNPLLKELDRQHEAFKLSVEAIRASLSEP